MNTKILGHNTQQVEKNIIFDGVLSGKFFPAYLNYVNATFEV